MPFLLITLFISQTTADKTVCDTIIDRILTGNFSEAIINVRKIGPRSNESDILLGFLEYTDLNGLILEMPPGSEFLCMYYKNNIIKTWEKLCQNNKNNVNILQILGFLYLYKNPKRTLKIADDIYKIDSLNCYSYILKAIVANSRKDYDRALVFCQKAYLCDSTSIIPMALIINLNIRLKNFPDAIKYVNKISYDDPILDIYHISGAICHIKIGLLSTAKYILSRIKIHRFPMDVYEQIDSLSGYIDRLSNHSLSERDSFYVLTPGFWAVLTPTEQNFIAFRDCYPKYFTYPKLEKHGFVYREEIRKLLGAQGIKKEPVFGVVIDRKGNIEDVVTLIPSGNQPLDDYYIKWFYTTKFKPATMFGQPQYYRFYKPINDILKGLFN